MFANGCQTCVKCCLSIFSHRLKEGMKNEATPIPITTQFIDHCSRYPAVHHTLWPAEYSPSEGRVPEHQWQTKMACLCQKKSSAFFCILVENEARCSPLSRLLANCTTLKRCTAGSTCFRILPTDASVEANFRQHSRELSQPPRPWGRRHLPEERRRPCRHPYPACHHRQPTGRPSS